MLEHQYHLYVLIATFIYLRRLTSVERAAADAGKFGGSAAVCAGTAQSAARPTNAILRGHSVPRPSRSMSVHRFAVLVSFLGGPFASAAPKPWISDPQDEAWQPQILWSTATGGMNGEVTIAGDCLLVGGNNGIAKPDKSHARWTRVLPPRAPLDEGDNAMICLDAKTGALRWRAVHPQVNRPAGFPGFGITSKPAVAGDRMYYLSVNWELTPCCWEKAAFTSQNQGTSCTVISPGSTNLP